MKRILTAVALAAALIGVPLTAMAATPVVSITQAPPATLRVGDSFEVKASAPLSGGQRSLLTLTLLDLETGGNVDLEGWIPGSAGQQVSGKPDQAAAWSGKAGKAGHYRVYVTAVPLDQPGLVTSSAPTELTVQSAPAPYETPLLAVAIGEPIALALAIGFTLKRRRRA